MFTRFRIVNDDRRSVEIEPEDVIAVAGSDGCWYDPHGGTFSDREHDQLHDVASGKDYRVKLRGRGYVPCRLVAAE